MTSEPKISQDCLGIDLGTTNSVVAYFNPDNEAVEIIPNPRGDRLTPSVVKYLPSGEILVGRDALESVEGEDPDLLNKYPLISNVKRFIGQKYSQAEEAIEMLEYQVIADHQDNPMIVVGDRKIKAEEVSAQVLKYLKQSAEEYLGRLVTQVVVTVPAYFHDSQRRATKDACTLAGMECLRLIAEPTSACICYGLHKKQEETVLVYDLGGGTIDISILELNQGIFEVVATKGNSQLGGTDVDYLLAKYLNQKYLEKIPDNPHNFRVTSLMAENLKKQLSSRKQVNLRWAGGFRYTITQEEFEEVISEFIEDCMEPVDQVLKDAELEDTEISQIVLVGGSTRIPVIQSTLSQWFKGRILNKSINPDEAVAYGASIQASIIKKVGSKSKELLLLDVIPLSLGIETTGGVMNQIIRRNSTLPCEACKVFSTVEDNQEEVEIKIYQGERQFTKDNIQLGTFTLEGLPRVARGVPKIMVKFVMDCDGLLEVSATDKNTGLASQISLKSESNLSDDEIQKLIKDAQVNQTKDYNRRQMIEEINQFEKYLTELQRNANLPEMAEILGNEQLSSFNQYLFQLIEWVTLARRDQESYDLETIKQARAEAEFQTKPFVNQMYSHLADLEKSGINLPSSQSENNNIEELLSEISNQS